MLGKYDADTIYNEDCYQALKNIPDKSIDLIVTDPPYEYVSASGGGCFGSDKRNYHDEYKKVAINTNRIDKCKIEQEESIKHLSYGFDYSILDEFCRILKKINIYIWCSKQSLRKLLEYFENKGCFVDVLTWHKINPLPTMNNTYANDTEYCVFAKEPGVPLGGDYYTKRKYYVTEANVADKKLYAHPTIKPLPIITNLVINSSQEGDIVLDPFIGSGTTAVACKNLNRHYIGFEIDTDYYKIAQDRINGITQDDRKQIDNGQMTLF